MKLTIVYDNEAFREGLIADWGFSCLVEYSDSTLLFDTGANGDILLDNMESLSVDLSKIGTVFISHDHWDHTGGLQAIRAANPDVREYWPGLAYRMFEIDEGLYTTGSMSGGPIKEHSLILRGEEGNVLIVGCSHPGLDRILEKASMFGKILAVIGGFHGFDKFDVLEGIPRIIPCHCTKHKEKINEMFPNTCEKGGVGKTIKL